MNIGTLKSYWLVDVLMVEDRTGDFCHVIRNDTTRSCKAASDQQTTFDPIDRVKRSGQKNLHVLPYRQGRAYNHKPKIGFQMTIFGAWHSALETDRGPLCSVVWVAGRIKINMSAYAKNSP